MWVSAYTMQWMQDWFCLGGSTDSVSLAPSCMDPLCMCHYLLSGSPGLGTLDCLLIHTFHIDIFSYTLWIVICSSTLATLAFLAGQPAVLSCLFSHPKQPLDLKWNCWCFLLDDVLYLNWFCGFWPLENYGVALLILWQHFVITFHLAMDCTWVRLVSTLCAGPYLGFGALFYSGQVVNLVESKSVSKCY